MESLVERMDGISGHLIYDAVLGLILSLRVWTCIVVVKHGHKLAIRTLIAPPVFWTGVEKATNTAT